jgi:glycosyltransferase involved in cell wall biosynthesis
VITWWPLGGLSLGLVERARRRGIPSVLFVLDPWYTYARRHDRFYHRFQGAGRLAAPLVEKLTGLPAHVRWPDAGDWVFCSRTVRQTLLSEGLRPKRDTIITPGVESMFTDAALDPAPPAWRWRLLYLGRVVARKGVHTAIEALPLLPEQAELRIVGPGDPDYLAELEHLAARLDVGDRVRFEPLRPRETVITLYREADAVVFPVEWPEPWGLVPLEAMALGRPVVATGRGGSGEYMEDRRDCLLFEAGDPADLARTLTRLGGDDSLRATLRRNGRDTAARHTEASYNAQAAAAILGAAASG